MSAKRIDIEALVNNEKVAFVIDITTDYLISKQIIASCGNVKLRVSQKAILDGMHSANNFGFEGGEVKYKGHLSVADTLEFLDLKKFTHTSGEIVAHIAQGKVTLFQNDGLIKVSKLFKINGETANNTGVICGFKAEGVFDLKLKFNYDSLNNMGHILAITDEITKDDIKAKLGAIKTRNDLNGLSFCEILIGPQADSPPM